MPRNNDLTPLERALRFYHGLDDQTAKLADPFREYKDNLNGLWEVANPLREYERQAAELRKAMQPEALDALQRTIGEEYFDASTKLRAAINATRHPWEYDDLLKQVYALTGEAMAPVRPSLPIAPHQSSPVTRSKAESDTQRRIREADEEAARLRHEIGQQSRELIDHQANSARKDEIIRELQLKYEKVLAADGLMYLRSRVESAAQELLYASPEFEAKFEGEQACPAYVMSIDIRRSTELMLKARDPHLFARFLVVLTQALREIVLQNHGVFDKFTGDGVLSFFPTFYSGTDAGLWVLQAAQQAHSAFATHYANNRECFSSVLLDVGLGIGIDFGDVRMVRFASEFTAVGRPVVYACRMAGARAGQTLVNQPAYEQLHTKHPNVCELTPVEIVLKHEGRTLAYDARLNDRLSHLELPPWIASLVTVADADSAEPSRESTAPDAPAEPEDTPADS